MRLLRLVFLILIILVLGVFLISNTETVSWSFWPLPFAVALPAYAMPLATLLLGLLIGGLAVWLKKAFKS